MATEILMPELGESVHEGTVSRWLKNIGDEVKEDEPIVEIMTDKVNTELPSPATGILVKINIPEGELVEVFAAMGVVEEDAAKAKEMIANGDAPASSNSAPQESEPVEETKQEEVPAEAPAASTGGRAWFTPVVRAMAKENGISEAQLQAIQGTGTGGRVTKKDLEAFIAGGGKASAPAATTIQDSSVATAPATPVTPASADFKTTEQVAASSGTEVTKLVGMRKMIADHMVRSSQVPVVSTLIDVDVTELVEYRKINKESFQATHGVKLTYTPFFIKTLAECLMAFPMLNSSLDGDQITTHKSVNMGCAVSLGKDGEGGLIVPVINSCDSKSLPQIAHGLNDIATRARNNELVTDDVKGGTFTITNPGSYGAVLGTPMISAPQAGIVGIYGIKETPVIVNGMIAIRSIMNVVLTYDHRLVDGYTAGRFLQMFKQKTESMDFFK